jgi:hypothetical protein
VSDAFLIDTNVLDRLVEDPGVLELVVVLSRRGQLLLETTHVQEDELLAMPPDKRAKQRSMSRVPRTVVPTAGFVPGVSRPEEGLVGDEGVVERVRAASPAKHARDALIVATARARDRVLVTDDARTRSLAAEVGVEAWPAERLLEQIRRLG